MQLLRVGRRQQQVDTVSLYYSSDIHGSTRLWKKFLKAGEFYKVDAAIMGGDLTGKAIIPVIRQADSSYAAHFLGESRTAATRQALDDLLEAIRFNGMYPWVTDADEVRRYAQDAGLQDLLFDRTIDREVRQWVTIADERLSGLTTQVLVMAGNDDPWTVDAALMSSHRMVFCDDRVVKVGPYEMISSSYANRTPWNSPREIDEDGLYRRLRPLAEQLENPSRAIFNFHVPPFASRLDHAIEINDRLEVVMRGGTTNQVPVGSTAVRQIIEEFQPLLSLHGHIHESRGEARIGRTLAVNPGSQYNTGRIHGVVVRLREATVASHQFVVG
jgi:uncharacterized protein